MTKSLFKTLVLCLVLLAAGRLAAVDFTELGAFTGAAAGKLSHRSRPNPEAPAFREFISGAPAGAYLAASSWPRRVRIGVVRIEFQADDNPATTGNGTWGDIPFFTFDPDGNVIRDPTVNSRSKQYIQRNLLFASQYYQEVSQGKVILEVPEEEDISEIYTLDKEMKEYGNDDDYSLRTSNMAVEAVQAADSEMDYSKYDIIVLFHAGCGQHTDFDEKSTDDIHPVSINRVLLREILADGDPSYMGISTNDRNPDGTPFYASYIVVFPETAVQDYDLPPGDDDVQPNWPMGALQGILGPMVHEFGHYFGLPDLYDTSVGTRPTIGFYALMATGFYNSISRIPCHPMAWSKVFLGWVEPTVVTGNWDNIVLQATELWGEGIKVIKVPVSSTEYFLLENRLRDENFNNVFDYNESGGNFFPDVMLDEYRFPDGSFAEFDWSLPNVLGEGMPAEIGEEEAARLGSGVLIWHIDEEVIRRNMNEDLTMNWVNTEPYHLGIDLEEADGIEHLLETLPASLDPGFGSPFDVYGGGVQGLKSLELENLNLLFGVHTNPSTVSYTGVASNIEIGGFRSMTIAPGEPVVDSLLGIDIRFNAVPEGAHLAHPLAGWPRVLGTGTSGSSPLVIDLDLARKGLDVVQVTDDGRVYLARGADGSGSFVAAASDSVHGSPAAGDIDGDGLLDVVVAAADGSVWAWKLEEDKPFLDPVPGWPVNLPGTFKAAPVLADLNGDGALEVVIGSCNGRAGSQLFALKGDGSYLAEFPVNLDHEAPAAAAVLLSGTGVAEAIYTGTLSGSLYSFDREGRKIFQRDLGAPLKASPVVGLMGLPGEGESYRVCAFTSGGRIWCLDTEGNIADGWPLETGGRCLAGGAVGDVDGDGLNELVVPVDFPDTLEPGRHKVYVLDFNASQPAGFPLSVNTSEVCEEERFLSAPALADLSGDGAAEVIISIRGRLTLAFDGSSGSSLPIARFILGSGAPACPVPADLDGDGRLDMLCSDGEGFLYAYETGSENPASVQWAGLGGGAAHTGFSSRAQQHPGPGVSTEIIPGEYCYVYPNPVRDSRAHLVYRLGKSDVDRVEVEVLTASGETVARLEGGTVAAGELANEVIWEVDKIASGVYLVLIKAHSQSAGTAKLIRKVAVIK